MLSIVENILELIFKVVRLSVKDCFSFILLMIFVSR